MDKNILIERLNAGTKELRLEALRGLKKLLDTGDIDSPVQQGCTNNHVHTKYSFSPYSPSMAVWMAFMSGLSTVGIIDHDAVNGSEEFIEAGKILGIATTCGFEIRTDWSATSLKGKRINNPDQISSAYICAHGLPYTQIEKADAFLAPIRSARAKRNRAMTEKLNELTKPHGIVIDYDSEVLPLSYAAFGGEVTERHMLYALSMKITQKLGKGPAVASFVSDSLRIPLSEKQKEFLADAGNEAYEYDLLNILKGSFVSNIYIDADTRETPQIAGTVEFIKQLGAIPTYCYLGDVGASPTGDKKAQKFEDDYLEDVFEECRKIGFQAIAFMPSRNTKQQLKRVMALCGRYGFMQISGEDINQPRQSFVCQELKDDEFAHLIDSTWALVGHEKIAARDINKGIFAAEPLSAAVISERIKTYSRIGLGDNQEEMK